MANSNTEIQSCPDGPTLGFPGFLTTADMQPEGGSKMELDCTARTLAASTSSWSPPCRT